MRVFTRDGVEKDQRAKDIEQAEMAQIRKDLDDEYRIVEGATYERLRRALESAARLPAHLAKAKGLTISDESTSTVLKISTTGSRSAWPRLEGLVLNEHLQKVESASS